MGCMNISTQFSISSTSHEKMIPITREVQKHLNKSKLRDGLIHLSVLHTTCGITINENADPDVVHDLLSRLNYLVPWNSTTDRHREGNSAAHLKSSLLGSSIAIPVKDGQLVLGTWQGIFFCEFDGPRTRNIHVTII